MKLSPSQIAMLCIIDESTRWDDGEVKRYWIPDERTEMYTDLEGNRAEFYVYGAAVVATLKALDARGLTARRRGSPDHSRHITEEGRILLEELRSAARPDRIA